MQIKIIKKVKKVNEYRPDINNSIENEDPIPDSTETVRVKLQEVFSDCSDFLLREIICGEDGCIKILLAYFNGFVDKRVLNQDVVRPVLDYFSNIRHYEIKDDIYEIIKKSIISNSDLKETDNMKQAIDNLVSGEALFFINGVNKALIIGVKSSQGRQVDEPDTEVSLRGPREGFVENLLTNTTLLRKRIKNPNLKLEMIQLGEQTKTDICICYIKGIANDGIVQKVRKRLSKIKIDGVLDSGYIEQYISDSKLSLFPTVGSSEKCDKLAGKLLEGRIAIFCDGTPYVLTVPYLFIESIQASEDYYDHAFFASFLRLLRLLALAVSNLLPALYVALVAFHHTVIPFKLMMTIAASREGIPFSPLTEALLMAFTFELLREAGIRMPRPIGQSLSIVGAIVLGEAAVAAGISSNIMVIIISVTAVCSFVVPPLIRATMLLRFIFLLAANFLGFLGISLTFVVILIHLCRLRSFGVPYMAPFSPLTAYDLKDSMLVAPIWAMITRPKTLYPKNLKREEVLSNDEMQKN